MPLTEYDKKYAGLYAEYKRQYRQDLEGTDSGTENFHQLSLLDKEKEQAVRAKLSSLKKVDLIQKADALLQNQHRPVTKVANETLVSTYDLDYIIASSLQIMDSGESPEAEYRDWIEASRRIETDINSNGTTQDEINARNIFIDFLDGRETEMKRVMELFSAAALHSQGYYQEEARKKLNFMIFKLSELRRLRARMQATKKYADEREKKQKDAEERAQRYLSQKIGSELEENLIQPEAFKPETTNAQEARRKVEMLRRGSKAFMRMLVIGYRNGKTRAQVEDELDDEDDLAILPDIQRMRGLTVREYDRLAQRSR